MTTLIKPHLALPVSSTRDLVDYFVHGARPREQWGVGIEAEKLVVDAETGEAAPFTRIEALLQRLGHSGDWRAVREEGHLIALLGEISSITLEPGGQLELSGQFCPDLHCSQADLARHIAQIVVAAQALGLAFLGLGVQPFTPLERIDWVPKGRYRIMGPYMRRTGDLGQAMMKQSAGLQVNLDYGDEADCIDKLSVGQLLAPVLYALFANSPLREGRPTGCLSTRGEIWRRTDSDRTGLLPWLLREGAGFVDYVEYALDVPMYFIFRDGRFVDLTQERFPFRRYLTEGFAGHRATLADWDLHLSTLFPEVRLRPQIEVRPADSLPPHLTLAVAALVKGILYDSEARAQTRTLFRGLNTAAFTALYRSSWRLGLKTPIFGRTLREVAIDLLGLARAGLKRQQRANQRGLDEAVFLEGIDEIAESGVTLAERLLARWHGTRAVKVEILLAHCGFRAE